MKKSAFFVAALALALTACGDSNKAAADAKAASDKAAADGEGSCRQGGNRREGCRDGSSAGRSGGD